MTTATKTALKKTLCSLGLATGLLIATGCDEFSIGLSPYAAGLGGFAPGYSTGYSTGGYYVPVASPVYTPVYTAPVVTTEEYYYEETVDYGGWWW